MSISRTITGVVLILIGLGFVISSSLFSIFLLIYGIPILIIGFFILFNNDEDKIEERKDLNKINTKK